MSKCNQGFCLQAVTSGANPINIKRGIDKTCSFLVGKLKENAKPVQGSADIKVRFYLCIHLYVRRVRLLSCLLYRCRLKKNFLECWSSMIRFTLLSALLVAA